METVSEPDFSVQSSRRSAGHASELHHLRGILVDFREDQQAAGRTGAPVLAGERRWKPAAGCSSALLAGSSSARGGGLLPRYVPIPGEEDHAGSPPPSLTSFSPVSMPICSVFDWGHFLEPLSSVAGSLDPPDAVASSPQLSSITGSLKPICLSG